MASSHAHGHVTAGGGRLELELEVVDPGKAENNPTARGSQGRGNERSPRLNPSSS